jgi:hypothetical protein
LRVGALEHLPLAFVHVGGDDDLGGVREQALLNFEKFRNNADDLATMVVDRTRKGSH